MDRGFGLELEYNYGEIINKEDFVLDWWNQAEDVDFKLGDEPVVRSGGSRMNKRARAGILKPTGSTTADADLQQLAWYFRGYLDNYVFTEGPEPAQGANQINTHEYYGGENKQLQSFRAKAVYDMLVKYIYGLLIDQLKLEVSNENMTVATEWIYKTEKAGIVGKNGETFTKPAELTNEQLFVMFYDVTLELNNKALDGVSTALTFEGNNNHDVDSTIGLGSRAPQKRAQAGKRENNLTITTTLTEDTVESILAAEYGEVGALEPHACKILQIPFKINISHCEDSDLGCSILFPKCTVRVEYDMSGADVIEATLTLDTLGSGGVTLLDNTNVTTDMYVKLNNNQAKILPPELRE